MERSTQSIVLAATTLTGFLVTFIGSAVNVALPLIGAELNLSAVLLGWIPLAYVLGAAAILMPMGRVADLRGRKAVFQVGLVAFTMFSFASAVAPSASVLLLFRVLHGLASSLIFCTMTAMVTLSYPPKTRGQALGVQVAGVYLGLTLGPVLGGIIVHNIGWRGLFVVVGTLSLLNSLLPFWKLRGIDWREVGTARFDVLGSALWAVGLSVLLLGFSYLPNSVGALLIAVGVLVLALFLWWEGRAADPVFKVDLLRRNRVFAFSNAAAFIHYSATFAVLFLLSLYLQYNRGLDAQEAGFVLVTGTFLQAAFSPLAGRLADRFRAQLVASAGMGLCVFGLLAFVFLADDTPYWYIVSTLCLLGVGYAFFASPITHTVMGSVDTRHVGVAAATLATTRLAGHNISMGFATLVLAIVVGRHAIEPTDYPHLLTSIRISFAIFTVLSIAGVAASLVGVRRQPSSGHSPE